MHLNDRLHQFLQGNESRLRALFYSMLHFKAFPLGFFKKTFNAHKNVPLNFYSQTVYNLFHYKTARKLDHEPMHSGKIIQTA